MLFRKRGKNVSLQRYQEQHLEGLLSLHGLAGQGTPIYKTRLSTKREALAWEREQLHKVEADLDMTFESFIDTYTADMKNRLKENTWHTKEHIIRTKLLPYFAKRKMNSIQPKDIIAWQNEMIKCRDNQAYKI